MAYEPTEWKKGDTITAEKLNNMEGGIEAISKKVFPVGQSYDADTNTTTLTKTWKEIRDAMASGALCYTFYDEEGEAFTEMLVGTPIVNDSTYRVLLGSNVAYDATSEDGYPSATSVTPGT